ncbi:MAG: hypothetical protein P1U89_14650 [Verrucomicrobiales bacterium]|nr:hypothetical protein [Verrucomicrobiales bacterium]
MTSEYPEMAFGDLPNRVPNHQTKQFFDYTVSLFLQKPDRGGEPQLSPNGSGTLISCGNRYGILTAWHVVYPTIDEARNSNYFLRIPLSNASDILSIECRYLNFEIIGSPIGGEISSDGPDICFIELPPGGIGTIKSKKSFWSIDRELEGVAPIAYESSKTAYCTIGTPCRFFRSRSDKDIHQVYNRTIAFIGPHHQSQAVQREGFDYVDFTYTAKQYNSKPGYEGVSGGGLWAFTLQPSGVGQELEISNLLYCGLPFYQFEPNDDGYRKIRHHLS